MPTERADPDHEPTQHRKVVPRGRIRRTVPMAGFAARTAGEGVVAALRAKAGNPTAKAAFHERTAGRYAELLGHSKGVLMKAGQLLSFVDLDAMDPASPFGIYQAALERLQAAAPPMDPILARTLVEESLGQSVETAFASFEREPMAAASIGQVHRAVLNDGRQVAVKVQYPGVADAIRDDLANTELLATFFQLGSSLAPNLSRIRHRPAAREITARISEELDYHHEAANITRFADLYRGHPFIRVPEVIPELCTDRVLTMTYLDGLSWQEARGAEQAVKDRWGEVIYRFVFGSFRHFHLFNGDPHPGNYRFGLDGTVGFVDFGCVKVFTEEQIRATTAIVRATVEHDGERLRRELIGTGFLEAASAPPGEVLAEWYAGASLLNLTAPQPFTITSENVSQSLSRMFDPRSEWHAKVTRHFDIPPDFVITNRMDFGVLSVLAELRATADWRAVMDELDGVGQPAGELGEMHAAWAATRATVSST